MSRPRCHQRRQFVLAVRALNIRGREKAIIIAVRMMRCLLIHQSIRFEGVLREVP